MKNKILWVIVGVWGFLLAITIITKNPRTLQLSLPFLLLSVIMYAIFATIKAMGNANTTLPNKKRESEKQKQKEDKIPTSDNPQLN